MQISTYFSYHEALFLPTWNREATEDDGLTDDIKSNLIKLFTQMDIVRSYFDCPINIHVAFRPSLYNKQIGGALNSAHCEGLAVDFDVTNITCDNAKLKILNDNKLEEWRMRMEHNPDGSPWIHLDLREVLPGGNRYFIP